MPSFEKQEIAQAVEDWKNVEYLLEEYGGNLPHQDETFDAMKLRIAQRVMSAGAEIEEYLRGSFKYGGRCKCKEPQVGTSSCSECYGIIGGDDGQQQESDDAPAHWGVGQQSPQGAGEPEASDAP